MKVTIFNGYYDTNPKESTLEEIVHLIRQDALLKSRTEKHRYYLSRGLKKEAQTEKASCLNFAVAARFRGGKDEKSIFELTFIGLAEFDHLAAEEVPELVETIRKDPHALMVSVSIGGAGVHVLFYYVVTNLTKADEGQFAEIYGAAFDVGNAYFSQLTGRKTDANCRKCTQLSGLAYDPEVFYQPDAIPFEVELPRSQSVRKSSKARLNRAVRASKALLAEEGVTFEPGSRNEYLMRMGYLLNAYGVPMDDALDWAIGKFAKRFDDDIAEIFRSCYKHTDEHGTKDLPRAIAEKGNRWATVEEIEQFLDSQVKLRYNVIRRQCEVAWVGCKQILRDAQDDRENIPDDKEAMYAPITDRDENTLWSRMMKQGKAVRLADIRNVLHSEYVSLFHPFREYFEALPPWDGVDYIGQLARTVHVKDNQELFVEYFRKWLVGILPAIFDEQVVNHEIMVFIGRQGNYKSTFFSLLLPPPLQPYFHLKMNSTHLNKDDMLILCECALNSKFSPNFR